MTEWWNSLDIAMRIIWGLTLTASLIFLIQSIMTFIGVAGDSGLDGAGMDLGGDLGDLDAGALDASGAEGSISPGANLYTFRNLINFILGFGWSFILLRGSIGSTAVLAVVSVLVGLALVAAVMYMFKVLAGMQQSGNISLRQYGVGCKGEVYLTIPPQKTGYGKVQITINNAVREYAAVTDGDEIKTGTPIRVVEIINEGTVLVEPMEPEII